MNKIFLPLLCLTFWIMPLSAQFTVAGELLSDQATHSGFSIGVGDMNGDLLDDVILVDGAQTVYVAFQNINGKPFEFKEIYSSGNSIWSLAVADIDNNGRQDIMVCYFGGTTLLTNNYSGYDNLEISLPGGFLPQSSNFVDVDRDGMLDIFICDDDGPNAMIKIDGPQPEFLDLFDDTNGGTFNGSGNYASLWTDFDLDGDLDLHISKCSAFAGFPTAPERINRLYINDDGVFINKAEEHGIAFGEQSWASDFGDIDNDGDLDLFVANHEADNFLYINENGEYINKSDLLDQNNNGSPYQCFFVDLNNDTYLDIVVSGSHDYIFYNQNGGELFNKVSGFSYAKSALSCTAGELNGDGYIDLVASFASDFIGGGSTSDLILLNEGGNNNYLFVNLFGNSSNINGVGARLELYGDWGVQLREIRSGVSYGIATSLSCHFGLGSAMGADSLLVFWPNGAVQKVDNIDINSRLLVYESACSEKFIPLDLNLSNDLLCLSDSIILNTENVLVWNDSIITTELKITSSGTYSATGSFGNCSDQIVQAFRIDDFNPDLTITADPRSYACGDELITLLAPMGVNYVWNDGDYSAVREVTQSFDFTLNFDDFCGQPRMRTISTEFFISPEPIVVHDTITNPGEALLMASGDSIIWYADANGSIEILRGDNLLIQIASDTTVYAANLSTQYFDRRIVPIFNPRDDLGGYANSRFNGRQYFNVNDPIILNSVSVFPSETGTRRIQLFDETNTLLFENDFELIAGSNIITIGIHLDPGTDYSMTTDTSVNMFNLGNTGPRLFHFNLPDFPYIIGDDRFELTRTNVGFGVYFYFYNWDIATDFSCTSDIVPVHATVTTVTAAQDIRLGKDWKLYPNPVHEYLTIDTKDDLLGVGAVIYNIMGQEVLRTRSSEDLSRISVRALCAGMYNVSLYRGVQITAPRMFVKL